MCLVELTLLVPKLAYGKRICVLENGQVVNADEIATIYPLEIIYTGQKKVTINIEKEHLNSNAVLLGERSDSESNLYKAYFCKV